MTTKVGGIGPRETCTIAFVGEALGAEEEKQLTPFIGPAGQLLTRLLTATGISRQQCYITNVIKERPPSNDISKFITITPSRIVTTEAYKAYLNELREELSTCSANVIVAVGKIALFALTGKVNITRQRGSILASTLLPGRKVIPIIHPAAALRQYEFTNMILVDLQRIKSEAESPDLNLPQRYFITAPTFEDAMLWMYTAKAATYLAVDIEVTRTLTDYEVSCIGFAHSGGALCVSLVDEQGDRFNPDEEGQLWIRIAELLEAERPTKITQNGVFDAHFLFRKYGIRTKVHHDTMIAMALVNPDYPKGLDFITSIYTREPYYKDDGKTWFKLGGKYRDLWVYNLKDCTVTLEAFKPLMRDISRLSNELPYTIQTSLIPVLIFMQERGIKVQLGDVATLSAETLTRLVALQAQLLDIAGDSLMPKGTAKSMCPSNFQCLDYFYKTKNIKPYISRQTGQQTVDYEAMKRIARKGYKEAELIMEMRKLEKMRSTYLEMKLDSDGRFRCSFNPVGTVNSRLSSSKNIFGTGGNAQNLPKSFRRFFVADDGYVCYEFDLGQAENRVVAYIAPEPTMIKAFEDGVDVHTLTASMIFGLKTDEVTKDQRQWGKKSNHGLNYDMGYKKFAFIHDIPENDARYIVERYHISYPGVRQYHAWIQHKLRQDRTLLNCYGRSRRFAGRWGDELFKSAYDYIPQSSVATKLNQHGLLFVYNRQDLFREVELLNQVHDSIWFQIPLSSSWFRHAEILTNIKRALEQPMTWKATSFVIPADLKMGLNFGELKEITTNDFASTEGLADALSRIHGELRATKTVPHLDSDIDDSGSFTEEMCAEMGDSDLLS